MLRLNQILKLHEQIGKYIWVINVSLFRNSTPAMLNILKFYIYRISTEVCYCLGDFRVGLWTSPWQPSPSHTLPICSSLSCSGLQSPTPMTLAESPLHQVTQSVRQSIRMFFPCGVNMSQHIPPLPNSLLPQTGHYDQVRWIFDV